MKKLSFILAALLVAVCQRIGTLGFRWSVTIVFSGPYHWQPFDT